MSIHALHPRTSAPFGVHIGRTVLLLALIPIALLYLLPRVFNLVATPYRLDEAVEHADRYNPGLMQIVHHESDTLAAFDAFDDMSKALADVRATDAHVAAQLNVLIGQIRGDLQATLNAANGNVGTMVASLDSLSAHVAGLHPHVDGASAAVRADRARMVKILAEARATAAKVHAARVSADKSATNVSGK